MGTILTSQWVVGFVDGEGCFHVGVSYKKKMGCDIFHVTGSDTENLHLTGKSCETVEILQILPEFTVVQHQSDVQILAALKEYFGCGVVRKNHGDRMCYRVRGQKHLSEIIVPFFEKHKLKTKKRIQFEKFRDVINLMRGGHHLHTEGKEKILQRKREMMKRVKRSGE
jgi:hypothetical protein